MPFHSLFVCICAWAYLINICVSSMTQRPGRLHVVSYNVRYDSEPDNITVAETIASLPKGLPIPPVQFYANVSEKPWSTRRVHIASDILAGDADVYGGQELLQRQVHDLQDLLGGDYAWIGVGRDDGKQQGEFSAIFYKHKTVGLIDWDTFWLSDTPFDVSKYPDAGSIRIATTAHFEAEGRYFTIINTHLDEQSANQRRLGASLILHRAKYEAIKTRRPVILTGDFNSPSDDGAYQIITGILDPEPLNKTFADKFHWTAQEGRDYDDFAFKDLLGEALPQKRSGNYATFTDFAAVHDFASFQRLDYIFGASNGGWNVESYHVGTNLYDDGIYASDHRPVYAFLTLDEGTSTTHEL